MKGKKRETFREDELLEKDLTPRYGSLTRKRRSITEFKYTLTDLLPFTYMEAQICVMTTHYVSGPSPIQGFVTARGGNYVISFVLFMVLSFNITVQ